MNISDNKIIKSKEASNIVIDIRRKDDKQYI